MSPSVLAYLGGMFLVFLGQRVLDGHDGWQGALTAAGILGITMAVGLRLRSFKAEKDAGSKFGHRVALLLTAGSLGALFIYGFSTDFFLDTLGLEGEAAKRWRVSAAALWPIIWLASTVPLLMLDRALESTPVLPERRIRDSAGLGLAGALGIALIFPANYLAHEHNERWDLAYFKTTRAGTATQALVDSLEDPIVAYVFLPPSSDVLEEVRGYFDPIAGGNLEVRYLDQAAEPRLANALQVRKNGSIAFSRGEVPLDPEPGQPRPLTQMLSVGEELSKAKRKLSKLDQEVQKILLELGKGDRVAYFTTGHGELTWKSGGDASLERKIRGLKAVLEYMSFEVKTLGPTDGLNDAVPDDADLVIVAGPTGPFQAPEVDVLRTYLEGGGALLIAVEPPPVRGTKPGTQVEDALDDLILRLGFRIGPGVLASEVNVVALTRNKTDRLNVLTDKFSSHASTTVLSKTSPLMPVYLPSSGYLEQRGIDDIKATITVRARPENWADLDGDLEFDPETESKELRPVAAAVKGTGEPGFRALVVADSGVFSDGAMGSDGNKQLAYDGVNWLIGAEALSGRVENEEDVKIEHSKEDQKFWFYVTVIGVPLALMLGGGLRLRRRRRAA
jgi:hypothetical protein